MKRSSLLPTGQIINQLNNKAMITVKDYTPTHREYFNVRILYKETNEPIATVRVGKNESLNEAIRNMAGNMGYLRQQITYEFI